MTIEDARRAGHGQKIGICGQRIFPDGVEWFGFTTRLRIVIFNEGYGVPAETIFIDKGNITLVFELTPITTVGSVADGVAEGKIEGGGLRDIIDAGFQNPRFDMIAVVPILTYTELGLRGLVVLSHKFGSVAFHHVVSETCVAQIFHEKFEVGIVIVAHILTVVVYVATTSPIFARIVGCTEGLAVLLCPCCCLAAIVVGHDVGGKHLVSDPFVSFCRIVCPCTIHTEVIAMVDDHICNDARALGLVGLDHRT